MAPVIYVKRLTDTAKIPERAHESAGYDLFADGDYMLNPNDTLTIRTGLSIEFPPGWVALIWDRSSMGVKGIHRLAGVIDPDYRGEWLICLHNTNHFGIGIQAGQKIAQVLFQPVYHPQIEVVDELVMTSRGAGGFGSTG